MDVERRLLLQLVVLGCVVRVGALVLRRAATLRAHAFQLVVVAAFATAALLDDALGAAVAWPLFLAFCAVTLLPSALVHFARGAAGRRRYGAASGLLAFAAGLLFLPRPLRREARLYAAFDAADQGDEALCRERLAALAGTEDAPAPSDVRDLARIVPAVAGRRWDEVLRAVDEGDRRSPVVLAAEVGAACETGDLRRALRAVHEFGRIARDDTPALAHARRAVLGTAGRAAFLEEALRLRLPVADGPGGAVAHAIARAFEASGEPERAAELYAEAAAEAHGRIRRDAEEGRARCERGELRRTSLDELELASVQDLERQCRTETPDPERRPVHVRAPATLALCALTALASGWVFLALGRDLLSLVAAGALSAPLVQGEGEWWRLGSSMLLHGGGIHLGLNLASVLVVGIPFEQRLGSVRTTIVYVASGFLGSAASVYVNATEVGVGASGAAMGLFGGLCVLLVLRGHLFPDRRRWLVGCAVVLVANGAIGWLEREAIDNAAHAGGLVAGAVLGWLLLPAPLDTEMHRGARRLVAACLVTLLAVSAGAVLSGLRDWRRSETLREGHARVVLPAWLRWERVDGLGLVGRRAPVPFAVQVGEEPAESPQPERLARLASGAAPAELAPLEGHAPLVSRVGEVDVEQRLWRARAGSVTVEVRSVVLRRSGVFLAFVHQDDPESRPAFERLVREAARTLDVAPGARREPQGDGAGGEER